MVFARDSDLSVAPDPITTIGDEFDLRSGFQDITIQAVFAVHLMECAEWQGVAGRSGVNFQPERLLATHSRGLDTLDS